MAELSGVVYYYLAYGLKIASNKPLPGLLPLGEDQSADITITLAGDEQASLPLPQAADWAPSPQQNTPNGVSLWRSSHSDQDVYTKLRYFDGQHQFEFVLSARGDQVWAFWPEQIKFHTIMALVLGPVLGAVLRLRDISCLHASVVAVGSSAVAFAGLSGAGKSTLAATLSEQGFPIVADDIAALDEHDNGDFWVRPGYPRLRLQPGIIDRLQASTNELAPVSAYTDKYYLELSAEHSGGRRFQSEPLPLGAVYILDQRQDERTTPSLSPLSAKESVLALIANTYGHYMVRPDLRALELRRLGRLANRLPVQRLQRPNELDALPQVFSLLNDDFHRLRF